ncbi:hypothetical protein ABZX95_26755 [Streptomyces sp. NPDC004232]|uniref:hypothetical protein n=1 Tax=Streptomyces sp. NPDC004232 TaxID=3154454 RepID=UPI001DA11DBC|nr:hypothetical protein [Streptomyces sp. tea 10]
MGERHSGGGLPGRRHVHPGADAAPGSRSTADVPGAGLAALEASLADVLRTGPVDPDGEQHAVSAFRAARDAGPHRARTRRRDDWRPRQPWRARLSVKATLSVFAASLTLGGVAVAAIGAVGSSSGGDHGAGHPAHPVTSAPGRAGAGASAGSSAAPGAHPDRPDTAKDTLAHCRAYEQVEGEGKALDATAWQRLLTAAGGRDHVAAYCAQQQKTDSRGKTGKSTDKSTDKTQSPAVKDGSGKSGRSAASSKPSHKKK